MTQLSPITTENLIDIIAVVGTIVTIVASLYIAKKTLMNTLLQQKKENCLKSIDNLPELLDKFIDSTKGLIIYSYVKPHKEKHKKAAQDFDTVLPLLQRILLMYGSTLSIKLFFELKCQLVNTANGGEIKLADLFSLLILLCTQIRQELTSEPIEFRYFFDLLVPEMSNHKKDVYISARKYIKEFGISVELGI